VAAARARTCGSCGRAATRTPARRAARRPIDLAACAGRGATARARTIGANDRAGAPSAHHSITITDAPRTRRAFATAARVGRGAAARTHAHGGNNRAASESPARRAPAVHSIPLLVPAAVRTRARTRAATAPADTLARGARATISDASFGEQRCSRNSLLP